MAAVSLCEETGTGAGGRGTTAGTIGAALAVLARLAGGSAALASAGLDSNCVASASMGRGRGSRLAATAGMLTTVPNIGAGWRPACRNRALAMMALTAAKASAPAITSFGLCSRIRIARPRSLSASTAIALARRRRRGMSSSLEICLGTFLHLVSLVFMNRILDFRPQRRGECRDVADRLRGRREREL